MWSSYELSLLAACPLSSATRNSGKKVTYVEHSNKPLCELASVTCAVQELRGFKRVSLAPGETKTVRFTLHTYQLAFHDREMRYAVEPGPLTVMVGTAADDLPLRREVTLVGPAREVTEPILGSEVQVVLP